MDNSIRTNLNLLHKIPSQQTDDDKKNLSKTLNELNQRIQKLTSESEEFKTYATNLMNNYVVENIKFETLTGIKPLVEKKTLPQIYQPKPLEKNKKVKTALKTIAFYGALSVIYPPSSIASALIGVGIVAGMTKLNVESKKEVHKTEENEKKQNTVNIWKSHFMLGETYEQIKKYVENDAVLQEHICPISSELLFSPVVTNDYRTYNEETLNRYISLQETYAYNDTNFYNPITGENIVAKFVNSPFRNTLIRPDYCFPNYPRMTVIMHRIRHILKEDLKGKEFEPVRSVFEKICTNLENQLIIAKKACENFFNQQLINPQVNRSDLRKFKQAYEVAFNEILYIQHKVYGTPENCDPNIKFSEEEIDEYFKLTCEEHEQGVPNALSFDFRISYLIANIMFDQNIKDTLTAKFLNNFAHKN